MILKYNGEYGGFFSSNKHKYKDVAHDIGASFTFTNNAHVWRSILLYKHGQYMTYYISLGKYLDIYFTIVLKISTIHRINGKIQPQELENG